MVKFAAALSLFMASAMASQDSAYYPGYTNPNLVDDMYYREAVNVIQDLSVGEFSGLYIQYHGCVWSEYVSNGDEGDESSGCGDVGDNSNWYTGHTPCFRANAAYSLYGVKSGHSTPDEPCSSSTYINSFFTTGGAQDLGTSVGINTQQYGASSGCRVYQQNGDEKEEDENQDYQNAYNNYYSFGTGCSADGEFVKAKFDGAFCSGDKFVQVSSEYENLNEAFGNLECVQVYGQDYDQAEDEQEDEQQGEDGEQQEGQGDMEQAIEEYGSPAAYLLSNSAACSHSEFPNSCPDPHGKKQSRDKQLYRYTKAQSKPVPTIMPVLSTLLLAGALLFYVMGNHAREMAKRKYFAHKQEQRELEDMSLYEQFSQSFHRAATDFTSRTRTFTEALAAYAEEEDLEEMDSGDVGEYEAPETEPEEVKSEEVKPAESEPTSDVDNTEVANAMLADKGVPAKPQSEQKDGKKKKKYKRPALARFSKWARGRFGRKKKNAATTRV